MSLDPNIQADFDDQDTWKSVRRSQKISKRQAKYKIQKNPDPLYKCYNCIYLNDDWKSCKKVEGYISKKGICMLFKTMTMRKVERPQWIGTVPSKDDFGVPITNEFIDGKTRMGPWGTMSPSSFKIYGVGLGPGKGQRYKKDTGGIFYKVQG